MVWKRKTADGGTEEEEGKKRGTGYKGKVKNNGVTKERELLRGTEMNIVAK